MLSIIGVRDLGAENDVEASERVVDATNKYLVPLLSGLQHVREYPLFTSVGTKRGELLAVLGHVSLQVPTGDVFGRQIARLVHALFEVANLGFEALQRGRDGGCHDTT